MFGFLDKYITYLLFVFVLFCLFVGFVVVVGLFGCFVSLLLWVLPGILLIVFCNISESVGVQMVFVTVPRF